MTPRFCAMLRDGEPWISAQGHGIIPMTTNGAGLNGLTSQCLDSGSHKSCMLFVELFTTTAPIKPISIRIQVKSKMYIINQFPKLVLGPTSDNQMIYSSGTIHFRKKSQIRYLYIVSPAVVSEIRSEFLISFAPHFPPAKCLQMEFLAQ